MHYLTQPADIQAQIAKFASTRRLWLDTETADWNTYYPRLSLIQVLAEPINLTGESIYILDVLDQLDLVTYFVNQIMANPKLKRSFTMPATI